MSGNSNHFHRTAPIRLSGLRLQQFSPTDDCATAVWDQPDYTPKNYTVKLSINGEAPTRRETPFPVFVITQLMPSCRYSVQASIEENQFCAMSELLHFRTAPRKVENVRMENISPSSCIIIWDEVPGAESYMVKWRGNKTEEFATETTDLILSNLPQSSMFLCSVTAKNQAGLGLYSNSVKYFTDFPGPRNIQHKINYMDDGVSVEIEFDPLTCQDISKYHVTLSKDGNCSEISVEKTIAIFQEADLGTRYTPSIVAETVHGAKSKRSYGVSFWTTLDHPTNIRFGDISKSSITICFDEPEIPAQHYQIRPISLHGTSPLKMIIDRQEALMPITIRGLEPGGVYRFAICSLHRIEELNSKEEMSTIIRSRMPAPEMDLVEIENNIVKIKWSPVNGADSYKVSNRIEHTDWHEREVNGHELSFPGLHPGTKYEFKVTTISSLVEGEESVVLCYTTAPDSPSRPQAEWLSPAQVRIWCDPVKGAEKYVFDIDGNTFTEVQPVHVYDNGREKDILEISVHATSGNKQSPCSEILSFEQTLLRLKKKFQKITNNDGKYIPPKFKNVETEELDENFQSGNFEISRGEMCLILGENSAGKTSACNYYTKSLPDEKLCVYLDCAKFTNEQVDVEEFLNKYIMSGIQPDCAKSVLNWMKLHSDLVVYIIDNADFASDFEGSNIKYDQKTESKNIFYNLMCKERDIFPNSQVLCTSNFEHVKSIINPTKCLEIIGFDDSRIKEMISATFEEINVNETLPENMKYFCVNPCYCKVILRLWKSVHSGDLEYYSSLLAKILEESMKRYLPREKAEKLRTLLMKIEGYPENAPTFRPPPKCSHVTDEVASVAESDAASNASDWQSFIDFHRKRNFEENTCKKLQEDIARALYYSYVCSRADFKFKALMKEEGTVKTIVSGLLKEDCILQLEKLFKVADKPAVDAKLKRNVLQEYIKKHMNKMMQKLYSNHEVTLQWLGVVAELDEKDLMKAAEHNIKVKNSMQRQAVSEVAEFLGKLPKKFCPHIEVTYSKDLSEEWPLIIELGKGKNQHNEMIKVNDKRQLTTSSRFGSLRRSFKRQRSLSSANPTESDVNLQNGNYHEDADSPQG